jgi:hypothetical protein
VDMSACLRIIFRHMDHIVIHTEPLNGRGSDQAPFPLYLWLKLSLTVSATPLSAFMPCLTAFLADCTRPRRLSHNRTTQRTTNHCPSRLSPQNPYTTALWRGHHILEVSTLSSIQNQHKNFEWGLTPPTVSWNPGSRCTSTMEEMPTLKCMRT